MGKEVITLQFGNFANYVGAHFWNFQDELLGLQECEDTRAAAAQIDLGTLYRAGETLQGELTYTPRLVLFDLKGSLGGVGSRGSLYLDAGGGGAALQAGVATWGGRAEVHRSAPVPKSGFVQQLEEEAEGWEEEEAAAASGASAQAEPGPLDTAARQLDGTGGVRYFTDFLKAHLHPRSAHQLEGLWHGVAEFGGFGDGAAYTATAGRLEDMAESIRFFAEECDSLQGFQCLVEDLSGFGQLAADVLQEVRDDFGNRPVLLCALRPSAGPDADQLPPADLRRWQLSNALSHAVLSQACSCYAAVAPPALSTTLPYLSWRPNSVFHTSAICAAAIDSATLPFRLAGGLGPAGGIGELDLGALVQLIGSQHPTPLAALSMALPSPSPPADLQQEQQLADVRFQQWGDAAASAAGPAASAPRPFTARVTACLTPGLDFAAAAGETYAESIVLRGPRSGAGSVRLGDAAAALDAALGQEGVRCVRQRALTAQPLPMPLPFPHIFRPAVSVWGVPGAAPPRPATTSVASCPTLSRLAGTTALKPVVAGVLREFRAAAAPAQGGATLEAWGYGREEVGEVCERLAQLAAAYDEGEEFY